MLVSLWVGQNGIVYDHVVGLCPNHSTPAWRCQFQIIAGAHPQRRTFQYTRPNLDWCCGDGTPFTTVTKGFVFWPCRKFIKKINQESKKSGKMVPEHIERFHIFCNKNHDQFLTLASLAKEKCAEDALTSLVKKKTLMLQYLKS